MAPDVAPAADQPAIERLEDQPIALDPRRIEDEFARIWRETTGAGYDESSIRLRVLNLVAIGYGGGALDRFEDVMQQLPQRHPCRGILAVASDEHVRLHATIAAHCFRSDGGKRHVCSEEILLSGATAQERELASAVLALLVPELPVTAWLIGEPPPDSYLADEVLEAADQVLIDSAASASPGAAFQGMRRLRRRYGVRVGDLAWGRLATWRALAAQLFDGADGARELRQVASIEIAGGDGAASPEPLLLAGWLASRLDLTLADTRVDGGRLTAALYDGSRAVRIAIAPDAGGAVTALRIKTPDARFSVEHHAESGHMHLREDWDAGSSRRTVDAAPAGDGVVIAAALDGIADGPLLEAAAAAALALLGE